MKEVVFDKNTLMQVGYNNIRAENLADAVAIAERNPEFAFSDKTRIGVRPIKGKENSTGFVYPQGGTWHRSCAARTMGTRRADLVLFGLLREFPAQRMSMIDPLYSFSKGPHSVSHAL